MKRVHNVSSTGEVIAQQWLQDWNKKEDRTVELCPEDELSFGPERPSPKTQICEKSPRLTEEEVSLLVVEAQDRQRLAAGPELPVGHVVPGVDQFDQAFLPTSCQNAAVLS